MKLTLVLFAVFSATSVFAWDAKKEFTTNCATCHSIGGGDKSGPDLAGVTERRSEKWLTKFIQYPAGMIDGDPEEEDYKVPDPVAVKLWKAYKPIKMAEQMLEEDQIKALLAYIKEQSKGKTAKGKILKVK
ncbi:MAG: cytochrome c [Bacteriovoracaceae bacterium]|nr:cytochrome c [Bacteriovoracaceae bacterium]